jgi:hypothetical protein
MVEAALILGNWDTPLIFMIAEFKSEHQSQNWLKGKYAGNSIYTYMGMGQYLLIPFLGG